MSRLPLVEGVLKYIKEKNVSLCMPGHKGGNAFLQNEYGRELYQNLIKMDITEVDGVDNLHHPEGIIKEAQKCLSDYYGSKKSYFLVNGSTSGNLAMIFSTFDEGDKVIVERNCHRSIFNGIILRKLKPIYVANKINNKYDAPLSIDEEHFLHVIKENSDAKGIIITYPNYYGICCNLNLIIQEAKKNNMKVIVDSAHGAHFKASKLLPKDSLELGADMVVMSAHKTLPSLTQTAYLHINDAMDINRVDFYVSMFLSTSPSYAFMCTLDYARYYLETNGEIDYKDLIIMTELYRNKINKLKGFYILGKNDLDNSMQDIDLTRYILNINKGYSASLLSDYLRKNHIQCEMNDNQNIILIFTPFNIEDDFIRLYEALKNCNLDNIKKKYFDLKNYKIPDLKLMPYKVTEMRSKKVILNNAEGKVCSEALVPYPPGIPLVNLGEIIDEKVIDIIKYYIRNGVSVLGTELENNQIMVKVVNEEV